MNELLNDDEQVEALKKWWKENGKSIIGGAALGLAAVGGWQYWQKYTHETAVQASARYEQFAQIVRGSDPLAIESRGKQLLEQYPGSTYAVFSALTMAKSDYEAGRPEVAEQYLQWALDHAEDPALEQLVRLRLGRLHLDQGDLQAAADMLVTDADSFAGEFARLRGDIAAARGDEGAAREAYRLALALGVGTAAVVEMKLAELGEEPSAS